MENFENLGPDFLNEKDRKLHTSGPVKLAEEELEKRGEETSQRPAKKISDWLKVIEQTHTGHRDDPKVFDRIKNYYHDENVIKPEDVQESVFLLEQKIARSMGYGDIEITDEFRQRKIEQIISDQTSSLDKWLEYLSSNDAQYPMWAKYWAFTSLVKMGKFEKVEEEKDGQKIESGRFGKRTKDTVSPFPTLNPRALAMTIGLMTEKLEGKENGKKEIENKSIKLNDEDFQKLLSTENFSKIYTQFLIELPEYSTEGLQETRGEWVKYPRNSDATPLVNSLEGHPLEWCTANFDTAKKQLQGGDFYVYYSINKDGEPVIPRVAIRMQEDSIGEVRGIGKNQNMDPYIGDIVKEKLAQFPDGKQYEKKEADMKLLTKIENKTKKGEQLTKDELIFIYEIDSKIEGFGYKRDPRIKEIIDQRNPKEDAPIVLDCKPEQIAYSEKEISKDTKAYIGPLFKDIFKTNIEHIGASFPEGMIKKMEAEIGGKDKKQLVKEMEENKVRISDCVKSMMSNSDFTTSKKYEHLNLVRISVKDLGFPKGATRDQIYEKAKILGLELCPAEVGPQLRLQYLNQPKGDYFYVGMKTIFDSDRHPYVFLVECHSGGKLGLYEGYGGSINLWHDRSPVVFVVHK